MSLEQSIDRLSGLIEKLTKQLEAGLPGGVPLPEAAKPEAAKPEATKPEATKPEAAKPEAAKPEKPVLDFERDVKAKFQILAANSRAKAVEILKKYQDKAGREGRLGEVLDPADYQEAYDLIEAALVSLRPPGA